MLRFGPELGPNTHESPQSITSLVLALLCERKRNGNKRRSGCGGAGGSRAGGRVEAQTGEKMDVLVRQPIQTQARRCLGNLSSQGLHLRHR